ncbi:unnamed protein product [Acanthoscelides obtectus]|uniref:Uncharacterized protein n=1 Tax=Acanthoscelides obtectus TaxID=200917 RepID=A0A9P0VU29_ACAOB|nr:unnamed protein product [Acanthoscelides obtectus]CAK1675483.1 hypothetical protein AOBTE_LOCUS30248 [Acanthoscelides obtectus]
MKPLGSPYGSTADVGPPQVKAAKGISPGGSPATGPDGSAAGLGLPAPMPRRASAYDVFAGAPGGLPTVAGPPMGRRASFRVAPPTLGRATEPDHRKRCGAGSHADHHRRRVGGTCTGDRERRMSCRRASHM